MQRFGVSTYHLDPSFCVIAHLAEILVLRRSNMQLILLACLLSHVWAAQAPEKSPSLPKGVSKV